MLGTTVERSALRNMSRLIYFYLSFAVRRTGFGRVEPSIGLIRWGSLKSSWERTVIIDRAWKHSSREGQNDLRLLVHLASQPEPADGSDNWVMADRRGLADALGVVQDTVRQIVRRTQQRGFVEVDVGRGGNDPFPSQYRLREDGRQVLMASPARVLVGPSRSYAVYSSSSGTRGEGGVGSSSTRLAQWRPGLGHPLWRESAYGLHGLVAMAHLDSREPVQVIDTAWLAERLEINRDAAGRVLREWVRRPGHFCSSIDRSYALWIRLTRATPTGSPVIPRYAPQRGSDRATRPNGQATRIAARTTSSTCGERPLPSGKPIWKRLRTTPPDALPSLPSWTNACLIRYPQPALTSLRGEHRSRYPLRVRLSGEGPHAFAANFDRSDFLRLSVHEHCLLAMAERRTRFEVASAATILGSSPQLPRRGLTMRTTGRSLRACLTIRCDSARSYVPPFGHGTRGTRATAGRGEAGVRRCGEPVLR